LKKAIYSKMIITSTRQQWYHRYFKHCKRKICYGSNNSAFPRLIPYNNWLLLPMQNLYHRRKKYIHCYSHSRWYGIWSAVKPVVTPIVLLCTMLEPWILAKIDILNNRPNRDVHISSKEISEQKGFECV